MFHTLYTSWDNFDNYPVSGLLYAGSKPAPIRGFRCCCGRYYKGFIEYKNHFTKCPVANQGHLREFVGLLSCFRQDLIPGQFVFRGAILTPRWLEQKSGHYLG
ncbi:hypothetical protein F5Y16DRAFT_30404 [Xylariaceae sp. FL0255]|nr:hypothetical protein F5Y16DRAFT_30404 [Xylariaceae sp. FL0255]